LSAIHRESHFLKKKKNIKKNEQKKKGEAKQFFLQEFQGVSGVIEI